MRGRVREERVRELWVTVRRGRWRAGRKEHPEGQSVTPEGGGGGRY